MSLYAFQAIQHLTASLALIQNTLSFNNSDPSYAQINATVRSGIYYIVLMHLMLPLMDYRIVYFSPHPNINFIICVFI